MATERVINYQFKASIGNVESVAGRVQRALKGARKSEGAEALEEIAKLGRGAGALLGLRLVGQAMSSVAEQLSSLRKNADGATVGWDQYAQSLVKSVPVLKEVYTGMYDIAGEITGISAEIEKTEAAARVQNLMRIGQERTADMAASRRAEEKRVLGLPLEARLIELKTERDATIRAIRDATEAANAELRGPQYAEERQTLRSNAARQEAEAKRMALVREREAVEQDRVERQTRRFSFAEKGIEFLQREAELQKSGASAEAGKLAIVSEYAKKRLEIHELLQRENISDGERALLRSLEKALPGQEKDALYKFGIATPQFSGGVAPTQESYFSTGLAAAGRENDPDRRMVRATEVSADLVGRIFELMTKYIQTSNFQFEPK